MVFGGLLLAALAVYRPGLADLWLFDDHPALGPLLDDVAETMDLGELVAAHGRSKSGPTGRPVAMVTFVIDAWVHGDDLAAWKVTSLGMHLVNSVLLLLLANRLCRLTAIPHRRALALSVAVAGAWLLHPLLVSTVLYTVQRMALLAALFQFAGLLAYLQARAGFIAGRNGVAAGWLATFAACLLLGTFSKETGVLLVAHVVVVELVLGAVGAPSDAARTRSWKRAAIGACLLASLAAVIAWMLLSGGAFGSGFATRDFTFGERLLTQPRIVLEYARLTLLPMLSGMKFIHDDIVVSTGLLDPWQTLPAILGLLTLLGSAWVLRGRLPLYAIGIGLFFTGHLLESTFLALDLMYEHRQYLPAAGLLLAAGGLLERVPIGGRALLSLGLVVLLLFGWMTWQRAATWSSEDRFYAEMVRINQGSPTAMTMAANHFAEQGRLDLARKLLAGIDSPGVRLNLLFYDCLERGYLDSASLASVQAPDILGIYEASGLMHLGRAGLAGRCRFPDEAYLDLLARWMGRPVHTARGRLLMYRGYYLARVGRIDEAVEALRGAHRASGGHPVALVVAAELLIDAGRLERAEALLDEAGALARTRNPGSFPDVEAARARMRTARERPEALEKFDPFRQ